MTENREHRMGRQESSRRFQPPVTRDRANRFARMGRRIVAGGASHRSRRAMQTDSPRMGRRIVAGGASHRSRGTAQTDSPRMGRWIVAGGASHRLGKIESSCAPQRAPESAAPPGRVNCVDEISFASSFRWFSPPATFLPSLRDSPAGSSAGHRRAPDPSWPSFSPPAPPAAHQHPSL